MDFYSFFPDGPGYLVRVAGIKPHKLLGGGTALVLGGLSLVGIFAGIMLRVRAFLFLGTSFLVLAITTVIWHAAVDLDQTWIWYATGIVVGVAIVVLFAVFEKRRQDVLHLVEKLKTWEA